MMTERKRPCQSALTLVDLFDAVALLQSCDGLPVEGKHLGAQLQLPKRWGPEWRRMLGTKLARLEREGWIARQTERETRHASKVHRESQRAPAGWVCVAGCSGSAQRSLKTAPRIDPGASQVHRGGSGRASIVGLAPREGL